MYAHPNWDSSELKCGQQGQGGEMSGYQDTFCHVEWIVQHSLPHGVSISHFYARSYLSYLFSL